MSNIALRAACHAERKATDVFCSVVSSKSVSDITFAELFAHASAYAAQYRARGVGPGDIVIIMLRHSPHLFFSFIGAVLAGAIPSFMPFPTPKQRPDLYWRDHAALFERLKPRLIVTYAENADAARASIADFSIETVIADAALLSGGGSRELPGLLAAADDVACLQHSSGTTGLKKGVMLTHRAIFAQIGAYASRLSFSERDRIVSWLPLYHDMGFVACFLLPLLTGTRTIALDPFEWVVRPQLLLEAIERYRGTLCWLPNFAFSHIVNATRPGAAFDLSSMRAFINCSEPCKAATFERFSRRFQTIDSSKLQVCYALAENVFAVTQTAPGVATKVLPADAEPLAEGRFEPARHGRPSRELLSCGSAIDGATVAVRDATGDDVAEGMVGEIFIAGDFLFAGYYRQNYLSATRLQNGWYQTGDLGFFHDGELFVTGRVDDMVIVNGRNYYAHEIESLVNDIEGVVPGRTVAFGIEDERSDAIAVVVLAECREPHLARDDLGRRIRADVLERLGLAVHTVVSLKAGQLVKTTSGKISRIKNKALYLEGAFAGADERVKAL